MKRNKKTGCWYKIQGRDDRLMKKEKRRERVTAKDARETKSER